MTIDFLFNNAAGKVHENYIYVYSSALLLIIPYYMHLRQQLREDKY